VPRVPEIARVTVTDGAVWRTCKTCGTLAAMAPEVNRCDQCTTPTPAVAVDESVDMSTVRRISALLREIPPFTASAQVRAAWFERKAELFDEIATKDPHLAEEAARLAEGARCRAEELRRGWSV
jgi:hypothetical protein